MAALLWARLWRTRRELRQDQGVEHAQPHEWGTAPEFVGPRHDFREKLLLEAFLRARPGPSVLNAGAGLGSFSRLLEERHFDVTSTDVSQAAVDHLRRIVRGSVVDAELEALPFEPESFDAVVLGEVLEHVRDDVGGLREVARVLKPGGVVAISVPANPAWFSASDRWAGHFRRYSREGLFAACAAAGLRVETCVGWGFPVASAYHRWVYDRRAARLANRGHPSPLTRLLMFVLKGLLQVDKLFIGVDRGALGFLAIARAQPPPDGE